MFGWWNDIQSLSRFNTLLQVVALAGAALTAVGTVVLWFKAQKLTRLYRDQADEAGKRLKAVEAAAEGVRKDLLAAQQELDIANQRQRLAETDASALRKELGQIRSKYATAEVALKERSAKRSTLDAAGPADSASAVTEPEGALDASQRKMLVKLLSSGPKGEIDLVSVLDNATSHLMAQELEEIFSSQGWTTNGIVQSAFSHPPEGIVLAIHSKATAPSYAKFLQRTLATIGLAVSAQVSKKYREWSISLIIGQVDT